MSKKVISINSKSKVLKKTPQDKIISKRRENRRKRINSVLGKYK